MQPWITFQKVIQYSFHSMDLLSQAMTHKSFAFENGKGSDVDSHNERLEFLGDAVLDLVITTKLMKSSKANEGELSKRRAALVNEKTLSYMARQIGLPEYLLLGKGENQSKGTEKDSIVASAFEALIGAVYLDSGYIEAEKFVERYFSDFIEKGCDQFGTDHKTKLQEKWQAFNKTAPLYKLDRAEGPDHQKTFYVSVYVGDKKLGDGSGKSRKEAEQKAAESALKNESI